MKIISFFLLTFSILFLGLNFLTNIENSVAAQTKRQGVSKKVHFAYAFATIKTIERGFAIMPITRDTTLKSGDKLKILINPKRLCYIYLIHKSSQGEMAVLYPYTLKRSTVEFPPCQKHYIPTGKKWFQFDEHTGEEKFYLLAAVYPLEQLEQQLRNYTAADKRKKREIATKITEEIKNLRRKNIKFKITAEVPVRTLGQIRGSDLSELERLIDLTKLSTEISADQFFSRTITIDHK